MGRPPYRLQCPATSNPHRIGQAQTENDRLLEISPLLPKNIINEFKSKFASISNIAKPSDANGLEAIHIYEPGEALSSFVSPAPTRPSRPSHPIINMEELTATQPTISLETATKNLNILK